MDALAQEANLSQSMISFIERDMRNPSLDILLRMTDALNVRLEDVIRRARAAAEKTCSA
jgi:transcriptional regulator with XRE-family HTH domain